MNGTLRNTALMEQIDQCVLPPGEYRQIFAQLERINKWSLNDHLLVRGVRALLPLWTGASSNRPLRIVDLGCGSGNHLKMLTNRLRRKDISCQLIGIDLNPHLLDQGRRMTANYPEITFLEKDIMASDFVLPECDLVISSQFLYRFSDEDLIRFFDQQAECISVGIVMSELQRHPWFRTLFRWTNRILGAHPVVRADGDLALQRTWKQQELSALADRMNSWQPFRQFSYGFRYALMLAKK